jgi:uncharacterized protein YajQ (UPF0234 family)
MPSIDCVNRVDMQEVNNAINNTQKAIANRFDFRGAKAEFTLDAKEKKIKILAQDDSKARAMQDMFWTAASKRGLSFKSFTFGEPEVGPAGMSKAVWTIRDGLEQDQAKKVVKLVKESGKKVQASIQGDEVRLSGKSIDDIREVMAFLQASDFELPLQFVNPKS